MGHPRVVSLAVVAALLAGVAALDSTMRQHILNLHNRFRSKEGSSDMIELTWDPKLAIKAQLWADECRFKPYAHTVLGETLAFQPGNHKKSAERDLITKSMNAMYSEKKNFKYGNDGCTKYGACNYTQIVWARSSKLGCATAQCPFLEHSGYSKSAWFLVCRYNPVGNYYETAPYKEGPACSAFLKGKCKNGLCYSQCEMEGRCKDSRSSCEMWMKHDMCSSSAYALFMVRWCRASCGLCEDNIPDGNTDPPADPGVCPRCDFDELPKDLESLVCKSTAVFQAYAGKMGLHPVKIKADLRPRKKNRYNNHNSKVILPKGCDCDLFSRPTKQVIILTKKDKLKGHVLTLDGETSIFNFKRDKTLARRVRKAQKKCPLP